MVITRALEIINAVRKLSVKFTEGGSVCEGRFSAMTEWKFFDVSLIRGDLQAKLDEIV